MIHRISKGMDWFIENEKGMNVYYPLLYSLILSQKVKMAFEFGVGFSTQVMLEALTFTGGRLISCDFRGTDALLGGGYDVGLLKEQAERWKCYQLSSESALKKLTDERFDFVLHDGAHDKAQVEQDLASITPRMNSGSLIVIHDTTHPSYDLRKGVGVKRELTRMTFPKYMGLTVVQII